MDLRPVPDLVYNRYLRDATQKTDVEGIIAGFVQATIDAAKTQTMYAPMTKLPESEVTQARTLLTDQLVKIYTRKAA